MRNQKISTPVCLLSLGLLLAGCDLSGKTAPSNWFPTSSIDAYISATQDQSGEVVIVTELREHNSTTVLALSEGDRLYSSLNTSPNALLNFDNNLFQQGIAVSDQLQQMAERHRYRNYFFFHEITFGQPEYFSQHLVNAVAPPRVYVVFERDGRLTSGEAMAELPASFQILAPLAASQHSRNATLTLSWAGSIANGTMQLLAAGVCNGEEYHLDPVSIPDTGSYVLNTTDYFPSDMTPSGNCLVALVLRREAIGSVSPPFAFGAFTAAQQRNVNFISIP